MRSVPGRLPKGLQVLAWFGLTLLVLALLAALIILAYIGNPAAAIIGTAVAAALLAVCSLIAKKLLNLK